MLKFCGKALIDARRNGNEALPVAAAGVFLCSIEEISNMTKRHKWMTFQADSDLESKIAEARASLLAATPGVAVSTSSAIRYLLTLGAETAEANRAPPG